MTSITSDILSGIGGDLAFKAPVRAATTANITLSGAQTIDGVAVVADDRVLVKNQTTTTENGIYVADTGAWSRARDFDGTRDVVTGTAVLVISGSTNADTLWRVSTAGNPTPGSAMAFTAFPAGPAGDEGAAGATGPSGSLDFSALTEEITPAATTDFIPLFDASEGAGTNNKMTPANLLKSVTGLTAETAVDTADEMLVYDTSAATADKATVANVLKAVSTLADTVITASDIILFSDASDSNNAKRDTVQGILDLVGSSGWVPIKTVTAAVDATIDFVNGTGGVVFDSTYKAYALVMTSVRPASDGVAPRILTSTNAGSSYGTSYSNSYDGRTPAGNLGGHEASTTSMNLSAGATAGNAADEGVSGIVYFYNPGAAVLMNMHSFIVMQDTAGLPVIITCACTVLAAQDNDAFRFLFNTGNITSGTFTLYGIKSAS